MKPFRVHLLRMKQSSIYLKKNFFIISHTQYLLLLNESRTKTALKSTHQDQPHISLVCLLHTTYQPAFNFTEHI